MKKSTVVIFLFAILPQGTLIAQTDPSDNAKSQIELDAQLLEAVEKADPNEIKVALEAGANPNWTSDTLRKYSIIDALLWGLSERDKKHRCFQCLNLLFEAGGKLQPCDYAILFTPIADGFPEIVELLIQKGASPTLKIEGMTPIEWAEAYGSKSVVDVLVMHGAKPVSSKEAAQLRFIHSAGRSFEKDGSFEQKNIIEMEKALENGAAVDGQNSKGETALVEAISCAYELEEYITVVYLLQKGANPNLKSAQRFGGLDGIALHHAVSFHGLMAEKGEDKTVYQKLIIEALLNAGAHVSSRGYNGMTPLHIAAKNNDTYVADILIKAGAKIMDRDDSGKTPLDYAESAEMINLLKSHGAKE